MKALRNPTLLLNQLWVRDHALTKLTMQRKQSVLLKKGCQPFANVWVNLRNRSNHTTKLERSVRCCTISCSSSTKMIVSRSSSSCNKSSCISITDAATTRRSRQAQVPVALKPQQPSPTRRLSTSRLTGHLLTAHCHMQWI